MDGLGTAPMFNVYLHLNVVTLSLQTDLEHQGSGSLSHLVSFSGDYIFPPLQHLEIWGASSSFATTVLVPHSEESLSVFIFFVDL